VRRTSALVLDQIVPGKTEIWLYHPGGRSRYDILPGGAIFIREGRS